MNAAQSRLLELYDQGRYVYTNARSPSWRSFVPRRVAPSRPPLRRNRFGFGGPGPGFTGGFSQGGQYGVPGLSGSGLMNPVCNRLVPFIPGHAAPGKGIEFHTQRLTSASTLSPPKPGMFLVNVRTIGGQNPGTWSYTYRAPNNAHFVAPPMYEGSTGAIGLPMVTDQPVNYPLEGTSIASALNVFNGGITAVELTYSNVPGWGPSIENYRAITVTGTESGTGGTSKTYTFDTQPGVIRFLLAMLSIATGTATGEPQATIILPVVNPYTQQVEAIGPNSEIYAEPALDMEPANSFSLTHKCISLGAATTVTIEGVAYY